MIYTLNRLLIILLKILNKFKRGAFLRKRIFSTQKILENNFNCKRVFNFVQIGANDGVSFDFLYDFVIKRNSQGVVIEPVKEYFNELVHNYKNFDSIVKVNVAVHPSEKQVFINKISSTAVNKYPDWVKGIASLDANHHLKTGIDSNDIIKESVNADSLMNILNKSLSSFDVDYFQVDTEGFDFEIIKMVDFSILNPKIIKYESVNLTSIEQQKLKLLLTNFGYYLFHEGIDTVCINLRKIKLY
jgi:FkbM family methyltransferase